jgi:hypothetical protein
VAAEVCTDLVRYKGKEARGPTTRASLTLSNTFTKRVASAVFIAALQQRLLGMDLVALRGSSDSGASVNR